MTTAGGATVVADGPADAPEPRRRTLRPDRASWPIWLFTAGLPIAFVLGIHGVAWPAASLVLGVRILANPKTRFPRTSIPLLILVCWMLLSIAMLRGPGSLPVYLYRWTLFLGCLTTLVWLVNVSREAVPTNRIVDWLAVTWICLILGAYLAPLLSDVIVTSPFQALLGPLGREPFMARISEWRFAETQGFLGYQVARPALPFGSANSWGSAVGILTPFFIRSWIIDAEPKRRARGIALLVVAVYPIIVSVNRGLWISLAVGMTYFAARKALRGRFGPFAVLMGLVMAMAFLLAFTSLGSLVTDRLDNSGRSNAARSGLYELAWQGALDSPLIGNGEPKPVPGGLPTDPPIGTHGLFWYLMFVHGFVGLTLFLTWLGLEVFRSGRVTTPLGWWTHLALVIGLVEVPYYGLLPHVILLGIAAGLSHREEIA